MSVIFTQSLFQHNEFYIFRDLGNDTYKEIKFHIVKGEIVEDKYNRLKYNERVFIIDKIL